MGVKAGLCRRCLVQVAYAIGVAEPLSITVMDYGTSNKTQAELTDIVKKNFDLRPKNCQGLEPEEPHLSKHLQLRTLWSPRILLGEAQTPCVLITPTSKKGQIFGLPIYGK